MKSEIKPIYWIPVVLVALVLGMTFYLEFAYLSDYDSHWWNQIPGFYALFGMVCCTIIIFAAKFIGKKIVNRDVDYYD
jgi:ABC-type multidrug transport system permease subunit